MVMNVPERQRQMILFLDNTVLPELLRKGQEYAVDGDPNGNFKRLAEEMDTPVLTIWMSHFSKHLDAIRNFVKDPNHTTAEPIDGRIGDAIAYLLILKTLKDELGLGQAGNSHYGGKDGGE